MVLCYSDKCARLEVAEGCLSSACIAPARPVLRLVDTTNGKNVCEKISLLKRSKAGYLLSLVIFGVEIEVFGWL